MAKIKVSWQPGASSVASYFWEMLSLGSVIVCHIITPSMTGDHKCEKYWNWQQIQAGSSSKNTCLSQLQYLGSHQKLVRGLRFLPGHCFHLQDDSVFHGVTISNSKSYNTPCSAVQISYPIRLTEANGSLSKTITICNPRLDFQGMSTGTVGVAACHGDPVIVGKADV